MRNPPSLIQKEVSHTFIKLLGPIKIHLSSSELEKLLLKLKSVPKEESFILLRNMGIPPDTCERLINILNGSKN